jgi:hypothetical protein
MHLHIFDFEQGHKTRPLKFAVFSARANPNPDKSVGVRRNSTLPFFPLSSPKGGEGQGEEARCFPD